MADVTDAGEPQAGGTLSGEAKRAAAVKKYQKEGATLGSLKPVAPNTGPSGIPKRKML